MDILMYVWNLLSSCWLGTLISIVSAIAAVVFYRRSERIKQLAFQHESFTVVGDPNASFPSEVGISFSGKSVPRVTLERMFIWNSGNVTISQKDMTSSPLCFCLLNNAVFLKSTIIKQTRTVSCAAITHGEDNQKINLTFEYFDPNDSIVIEFLHSGESKDIKFVGEVKEMREGIKNFGKARWIGSEKSACALLDYLVVVLSPVNAFSAIVVSQNPNASYEEKIFLLLLFSALLFVSVISLTHLMWARRKRYPHDLELQ